MMRLHTFSGGVEIRREEKAIVLEFLKRQTVLSTCRVNGGLREDLRFVCNCQGSEPRNHTGHFHEGGSIETYAEAVSKRAGIDKNAAAFMFTAANMNNMVYLTDRFEDLEVAVVCTAGAKTNAARAGDPASYFEREGSFHPSDGPGTINLVILINLPLLPGAFVTGVMTATEAKTAALEELLVASCYSPGGATGTGTDQIAVVSPSTDGIPVQDAGKHSKLGEMIGTLVKKAVKEGLRLQDGWVGWNRGGVDIQMGRFGVDRQEAIEGISSYLTGKESKVLKENSSTLFSDTPTSAALAGLLRIWEMSAWEILEARCVPEVFLGCGAELAAAVSGKYERIVRYRDTLQEYPAAVDTEKGAADFIFRCMALGLKDKWS